MVDPNMSEEISKDNRNQAMLAHLLSPFLWIFPGLLFWILNKNKPEKTWVAEQAKEALNFQITMTLVYIICGFLTLTLIGMLIACFIYMVAFISCIVGAIKTSSGKSFRYPFALRLVQ